MMFAQHLKRALADIQAHGFLNAVTVVTVSIAVLIVSSAFLFFLNTRETLDAWQQQARIMAYLTAEASSTVSSLTRAIESIDGVRRARFIPREEILQELKTQMPNQASLFEHLEGNPLPDAFEIELKPAAASWEHLDAIAERIGSLQGIETVEYGRQWAAVFRGIVHVLGTVGAAIIGLFVVAAVMIIATTTRLAIHARQDEVEIMRLVGAADWFIKAPFFITGLVQGFLGGCIGVGALFILFDRVMEHIGPAAWAGVLMIRFLSLEEMAMIGAGSMLVGWLGAFISLGQRADRMAIYGITAMVLLVTAAAYATGDSRFPSAATGPSLDSLRQEAEMLQRDILEREAEIDRMARREDDVVTALEAAGQALHRYRRQALAAKEELEQLQRKIASTQTAEQDLLRRIRANETYLSKRLLALYTFRRIGPVNGWASSASIVAAVKHKAALERILAHDEAIQQSLTAHSIELQELRLLLLQQEDELRLRAATYERNLVVVNREQSHRQELLSRIRTEKMVQADAVDSLQEAAQMLERKILALVQPLNRHDEPSKMPTQRIAAWKGLLKFPVKGKIISSYGPYRHPRLNAPAFRNGIDIAAERGEPVLAVYGGTIIYSSWFIGYGNVVIIDHGDHFYSVYAHLEDVFKSVNNRVDAGDVFATVGDSGAMGSTGLYFELRHYDRTLDPLEWLKRGS